MRKQKTIITALLSITALTSLVVSAGIAIPGNYDINAAVKDDTGSIFPTSAPYVATSSDMFRVNPPVSDRAYPIVLRVDNLPPGSLVNLSAQFHVHRKGITDNGIESSNAGLWVSSRFQLFTDADDGPNHGEFNDEYVNIAAFEGGDIAAHLAGEIEYAASLYPGELVTPEPNPIVPEYDWQWSSFLPSSTQYVIEKNNQVVGSSGSISVIMWAHWPMRAEISWAAQIDVTPAFNQQKSRNTFVQLNK